MKISKVLSVTKIPEILNLEFKEQEIVYANISAPFIQSDKILCYQPSLTVNDLYELKCFKTDRETAVKFLERNFDITKINLHQKKRYVAIYVILSAAYQLRGSNDTVSKIELEKYESFLKHEVLKRLDFNEIKGMKNLKEFIKRDSFLMELCYVVNVYKCANDSNFRHKAERCTLSFGNKKYSERLERVFIEIYEDKGFLTYSDTDEIQRYIVQFGESAKLTVEDKIKTAVVDWHGRFLR